MTKARSPIKYPSFIEDQNLRMNSSCTCPTTPALDLTASSPSSQCLTSTLTLEGHQPLQSLTWGIGNARWKEGCLSSSTIMNNVNEGFRSQLLRLHPLGTLAFQEKTGESFLLSRVLLLSPSSLLRYLKR